MSTDRSAPRTFMRTLTYRTLPLAVMAATLSAIPATPSLGRAPEAAIREIVIDAFAVPEARTASALPDRVLEDRVIRDWAVSPEVASGAAVMVGADWGGDPEVVVEVRSRRGGVWSAWQFLTVESDHAADGGSAEAARGNAAASDPVWLGPSEVVQVRRSGGTAPVRLTLVDAVGGDGLGYQPPESRGIGGFAFAATTEPAIISRASWGADESMRSYVPVLAPRVRFVVVHHTAGGNDYTPEQADDVVRSIYAYHTQTKGWDDIAYNFLIDRFGRVYEGRSGGTTNAVQGAHAAGWNYGSAGISMMGNYDNVEPSQESIVALQQLAAWRMDQQHLDPHGTTVERSGGGSSNRYGEGTDVELPVIIGHRTTNNTSCPGGLLFDDVMELADRVAPIGTPKAYGGPPAFREQPSHGIRPRWKVSFTEPLEWRLTISDEAGTLVRSTGGYSATGIDLEWDLRNTDGVLVPGGMYRAELTGWYGARRTTPLVTQLRVTPPAERVAGTSRTATAVEMSSRHFATAQRVVLASAGAFPDALVATPLAGSLGSPVLLVPQDRMPDDVVAEIRRLGADKAYLIGGPGRISPAIEAQLRDELGFASSRIVRLAGADRFATAAAVASVVVDRENPAEVLIALGSHPDPSRAFPDALSAGGFGAALGLPVLLVEPNRLPQATSEFLSRRRWANGAIVFGGPGAVDQNVQAEVSIAAGNAQVRRFAGGSRYETSTLAADDLLRRWAAEAAAKGPYPNAEPTGMEVITASGVNWPDALGAGAAAAYRGAVFLLTADGDLDAAAATRDWLVAHADALAHVEIAGGPNAVSDLVRDQTAAIVSSAGRHLDPTIAWPPDPWLVTGGGPIPGPTGTATPAPGPTETATPTP